MIGQVCIKPVVTASAETTIQKAAQMMRARNVGALVVARNGKAQGVLTDRDIAVDVVARGKDPAAVRVGQVMRKNPAVIRADKGILDATKILGAKGVRRLPVVKAGGKLVGIIALDDLMMLLGSEMGNIATALSRGLRRARV
ncbi:MAG: CBS domain-containing protein [Candidatus Rokuibacteriota bacterium]